MPLVEIAIPAGWHEHRITALADAVHDSLVETMNVPLDDRFQVITEHPPARLRMDPHYLGIRRGPDAMAIRITLRSGRHAAQKRALYAGIARRAAAAQIRPEDLLITLIENTSPDWSFGAGIAQYAEETVI